MSQRAFKKIVLQYYAEFGRHELPWRRTVDPYRILVSEVMLQQTQVERVIPKYKAFLKRFPTAQKLAVAPLADVLRLWQGLGYNRRAKALHECAKVLVGERNGVFPHTAAELQKLPGIGPYTAGAILAFAMNQAVPVIETNIRTVYLHHFFTEADTVSEKEILKLVAQTLDHTQPRLWYWALMDYGSYLKKEHGNPNARSKNYQKQSVFKGSDREIRGAILKLLAEKSSTVAGLCRALKQFDPARIDTQLSALHKEGLIEKRGSRYRLPQ